ncbi:ABC transporter substrate-binding protein [Ventosimonas gracilis]|uniref:ABC transporter substrate-binding protein n=1 Tax=Ventosimonas gracilis TaxID=1680762 RepID=A0A139SSK5_9GAMM|nr:ABC transporter substrate-binding protein [Ventosimonas gracilis]KXU37565.1 ABC transporter substrate-binding protein [Ventosimonas gracilis]
MRLIRLLGLLSVVVFGQAQAEALLPERWVSAGSALSEWIAVLGGQHKLVGVDSTSQFPQVLTKLPSIGYQRQLSAEGILSLKPDILVGTEEMGPPPVLEQLKAAGLRIERFSAKADLEALADNLTRLGHLLGAEEQAAQLLNNYRLKLAKLQAQVREMEQNGRPKPKALLLLSHAGTRPMAAGTDTAADWLIKQAGGENLATHQGYKAISSEALLAMNPEVLIFTDRSLPSRDAMQAQLAQDPALAASRAAQSGRLLSLEPTLLVGGLGARLPEELARLMQAFYSEHP